MVEYIRVYGNDNDNEDPNEARSSDTTVTNYIKQRRKIQIQTWNNVLGQEYNSPLVAGILYCDKCTKPPEFHPAEATKIGAIHARNYTQTSPVIMKLQQPDINNLDFEQLNNHEKERFYLCEQCGHKVFESDFKQAMEKAHKKLEEKYIAQSGAKGNRSKEDEVKKRLPWNTNANNVRNTFIISKPNYNNHAPDGAYDNGSWDNYNDRRKKKSSSRRPRPISDENNPDIVQDELNEIMQITGTTAASLKDYTFM